ncbi:MAG: division/cell wall cluster transcriptional repressor MraZ [Alkalilacustris sp.]
MARRFRGQFPQKVDAKGRVSIPAQFRRVLEACDPDWSDGIRPNLVLHADPRAPAFLTGYTIEAMDDIDRRVDALPRASAERKLLEQFVHSQSHPTQLDDDGRIVLPQRLRDRLALTGDALFVGVGDSFRIWHPDAFAAEEARIEEYLAAQGPDFDPLSLLPDLPAVGDRPA